MKELQILISKSFDFIVKVDEETVFESPVENADVLDVMNSLCSNYPISAGETTLQLYNFIEEKIDEIRAEKQELLMYKKFFTSVA